MTFDCHGVISASDFPRDLRGWVALSIVFAHNTHCKDRDAALELLLYEADRIIEQVRNAGGDATGAAVAGTCHDDCFGGG